MDSQDPKKELFDENRYKFGQIAQQQAIGRDFA
jgi:hypothetical protein